MARAGFLFDGLARMAPAGVVRAAGFVVIGSRGWRG
jgi:hypothetical protein